MKTLIFFTVLSFLVTGNLYAQDDGSKRTSTNPINYKNPDGTRLVITLQGDDTLPWAVTSDGYTVLPAPDRFYVYAVKNKNGDLIPSKMKAHSEEERGKKEQKFILKLEKGLTFSESQIQNAKSLQTN